MTTTTTRKPAARKAAVRKPPVVARNTSKAAQAKPTKPATRKAVVQSTPKMPESVTLTHNGEPSLARNSISYMAWAHSVGLEGKTRLGVKDFVAHLAKHHGIDDPFAKSWDIVLANGHRVGAIVDGKPPKVPAKADLDRVAVRAPRSSSGKKATSRKPSAAKLNAQKAEKAAMLAWRNGGEVGPKPATPVTDEYARIDADAKAAEAAKVERVTEQVTRRRGSNVQLDEALSEAI